MELSVRNYSSDTLIGFPKINKRKTPNSNRRRERFSPKELEAQLFEKTMLEKYPNSKLRRSSSKSDDSDTLDRSNRTPIKIFL